MYLRSTFAGLGMAAVLAIAPVSALAAAAVTIIPVARDSMLAPDGNGRFSTYGTYGEPVLNDAGQVAFTGRFSARREAAPMTAASTCGTPRKGWSSCCAKAT